MKTANSRVLQQGQLDEYSIKRAFAFVPTDQLEEIAQRLREHYDWYGDAEYRLLHDCAVEVVRIKNPSFETKFIPAI